MTVTALIADDEELLRDELRRQLAQAWPELEIVGEAANGDDALAGIQRLAPDIAFLDIRMPGRTGLQVAQQLTGTRTHVVFVTAYDEFALAAFEREAIDYLVKPVDGARLARTVERLKRVIAQAQAGTPPLPSAPQLQQLLQALAGTQPVAAPLRWIRASRGDTTFHVPVADVLFLRSDDKYTVVTTAGGEHLIRTALSDLATELDSQRFWQIHRSIVVNMDHVSATRRDDGGRVYVQLRGHASELPVSRAYQHLFRQM